MSALDSYRGVILDADSLGSDIDLNPIHSSLDHCQCYGITSAEDTAARLHNCQVAITNKVVIDDAVMTQNPQLKLICVAATGTNNVDLIAAQKRNIKVKNAVGYSTDSVAQHTFNLILALCSQLKRYQQDIQIGSWSKSPFFCLLDHPVQELAGKTLGLIGHGNTGQAVARISSAFGMQVLISQRPGSQDCPSDRTPLTKLLQDSDIVSLHCPLDSNTRHLISWDELALMKSSALLINCARGGIVDEHALLTALSEQSIAAAALDVLEQEPPAENHPLLRFAAKHSNLILTPHIAWASVDARQRLVQMVAANISDFISSV